MEITAPQLKNLAKKVYEKHGFVDVIKLANELGIDVLAQEKSNDYNSAISYDDSTGKYSILVNISHPITRQRFSIAHEIAHFILHKSTINDVKLLHRGIKTSDNRDTETEADRLAGEVLMPEELVRNYLNTKNIANSDSLSSMFIKEIADYFKVSPIAATIRLRELGYSVSLAYVV